MGCLEFRGAIGAHAHSIFGKDSFVAKPKHLHHEAHFLIRGKRADALLFSRAVVFVVYYVHMTIGSIAWLFSHSKIGMKPVRQTLGDCGQRHNHDLFGALGHGHTGRTGVIYGLGKFYAPRRYRVLQSLTPTIEFVAGIIRDVVFVGIEQID